MNQTIIDELRNALSEAVRTQAAWATAQCFADTHEPNSVAHGDALRGAHLLVSAASCAEIRLIQLAEANLPALLDRLEQYRQADWVPVAERMPEDGVQVLVTVQYPPGHELFPGEGFTVIANYESDSNDWESMNDLHDCITRDPSLVTAWRYKPRPYVRPVEVEATP